MAGLAGFDEFETRSDEDTAYSQARHGAWRIQHDRSGIADRSTSTLALTELTAALLRLPRPPNQSPLRTLQKSSDFAVPAASNNLARNSRSNVGLPAMMKTIASSCSSEVLIVRVPAKYSVREISGFAASRAASRNRAITSPDSRDCGSNDVRTAFGSSMNFTGNVPLHSITCDAGIRVCPVCAQKHRWWVGNL